MILKFCMYYLYYHRQQIRIELDVVRVEILEKSQLGAFDLH